MPGQFRPPVDTIDNMTTPPAATGKHYESYSAAKRLIESGQQEAGIARLIELATEGCEWWEVYGDLGAFALETGDKEAALALLDTAIKLHPDPGLTRLLARLHQEADTPEESLALLGQLVRANPSDHDSLHQIKGILEESSAISPIAWARLVNDLRHKSVPAQALEQALADIDRLEREKRDLQQEIQALGPVLDEALTPRAALERMTAMAWRNIERDLHPAGDPPSSTGLRKSAPAPATQGKLGFFIHSAELYNHYKGIWHHLGTDNFEIVVGDAYDDPDSLAAFFASKGYRTRMLQDVLARGERYGYLVSNHPFPGKDHRILSDIANYNIRMMYALGKARWNFAEWNRLYDMILCFGPFQAERLAFCTDTTIVQVGYPRFDTFFTGEFDRNEIARTLNCDPNKKTLVWLPTWGKVSSVRKYAETLAALRDDYNIVVKLHPMTDESDPTAADFLRSLPFNAVIADFMDNVALYTLADYVACDYGGPMFGALYVDKNLLLLDLPDAEDDPLVGENSADGMLRSLIPHVSDAQPATLAALLADSATWARQTTIRQKLRPLLFAPYYGISSQVTANILKNIATISRMEGRRR